MEDEATYICENCGEEIVIPVDLTEGSEQEYVEDCPECCSPCVIHIHIDRDGHIDAGAEAEQDRG